MKKINRILSLLLAAVLVLGMIPAPVSAAGQEKTEVPMEVRINPHYADLFDLEEIQAQTRIPEPGAIRPFGTVHQDVEAAAAAFRQDMVNRQNWISVSFVDASGEAQSVINMLYDLVFAHTGNPKEGDSLMWQWGYWKPESVSRSRVDGGYRYDCTFYLEYYTNAEQEQALDKAVEELLNSLNLDGRSDYEKIFLVYDYMTANIRYDYEHLGTSDYFLMYTPYAALINKTSVCQGYALLFYRLMLELGIDCRLISGWGGGPHGWNIVELDGLYYNVDATWDEGYPYFYWGYFLNSFWDFLDHERDMEYDTIAFHNEYPMAAESYEPGVEAKMDPYIYAGYANVDRTAIWYVNRNGTLELDGTGNAHDYGTDEDNMPYYSYWIDEITGLLIGEGITGLGTNSFNGFYMIDTIRFNGNAPAIASNAFTGVTATAYYPANNSTWTADKLKNYGGNLTWIAEGGEHTHSYTAAVTDPTCTEGGFTTYTCSCGDSYEDNYTAALGHDMGQWEIIKAPTATEEGIERRSCTRCDFTEDRTVAPVSQPCGENAFWIFENGTLTIWGTGKIYDSNYNEVGGSDAPWAGFAEKITALVIEDGITGIGQMNFWGLSKLQSIAFPDSLTFIGNWAFWGCESLETVDLPDHLTGIGQEAFKYCFGLKAIEIPASVTFVGGGVFEFCTALTDVYFRSDPNLPSFMTAHSVFRYCRSLEQIRVEEGHIAMKSIDGVLYLYDAASGALTMTNYPCGRRNAEFRIPDGTVTVSQFAMEGNSFIESVVFPGSVTQIDSYALSGCSSLKTIRFEGSAPVLGEQVFFGCNLTAYYPANDPSWEVINSWSDQDLVGGPVIGGHQGSIVWIAYEPDHTHEYSAVVTAPTCTEQGYTTYTCTICGDSYVTDYTEATGHSHEAVVTDPTCTEQGYTTYICACGDRYVTDYTDALGHDWNGASCTRCGELYDNPFTDVPEGQFFYEPVLWAVEKGITTGASADSFNPGGQCQRAHVVTFLWRAAGCPEPTAAVNPFEDVKPTDFYYKAVLWAVENGITNGVDATHFGPFTYCNRAQVVTFLYRAMGSPEINAAGSPFADVISGAWYEAPILWAVANGVTNGMSADTFGVETICNRAQVVTFLYRTYVN